MSSILVVSVSDFPDAPVNTGWLASLVLQSGAQPGVLVNVAVGVVGAMLGGWLIAPLFGAGTANQYGFTATSLMAFLLGAVVCWRCSVWSDVAGCDDTGTAPQ